MNRRFSRELMFDERSICLTSISKTACRVLLNALSLTRNGIAYHKAALKRL